MATEQEEQEQQCNVNNKLLKHTAQAQEFLMH